MVKVCNKCIDGNYSLCHSMYFFWNDGVKYTCIFDKNNLIARIIKGVNIMKYIRLCNYCKNNRKDDDKWGSGYIGWVSENNYTCPFCQHELIDTILTSEEDDILIEVSRSASFYDAMIELKSKDIIEFNLKMAQFKSQVEQQKSSEQKNDVPRCPNCNSTNIKPISGLSRGASIAMLGIFSKKINKSFECKNCGYTW